MIRIFSSPVLAIVMNLKNILQINGISSTITNQYLSAGVGEIPPIECWPQLWVTEQDFERASAIIETNERDLAELKEIWICPKCGEEIEGQFAECWNCETAKIPD
jgi:hypothetical protein